MVEERNALKKEVETKNHEVQEKVQTITQVRKIGRRYKTQYDELKVQHDKVRACSPQFCIVQSVLLRMVIIFMLIELKSILCTISYRWLLRLRQAQPRLRRLVRLQSRNCRASEIL